MNCSRSLTNRGVFHKTSNGISQRVFDPVSKCHQRKAFHKSSQGEMNTYSKDELHFLTVLRETLSHILFACSLTMQKRPILLYSARLIAHDYRNEIEVLEILECNWNLKMASGSIDQGLRALAKSKLHTK